jgi:hypothetical protein
MSWGCQNFPLKISLEPTPSSTSLEPVLSSSPPRASALSLSPPRTLRFIILDHGRGSYAPPSSPTRAGDAVDHAGLIPKPAMPFPSPQQHRPPWAHDVVHPVPFLSLWRRYPHRPQARSAIVLAKLMTSEAHDAIEPAPSPSPQFRHLHQARKATLYIFLCHFGPTNPDFHMIHCHIALISYIAFILLHCFDVLHCHTALIYCIAFNMSHCFDILHCFWYVVLLWYATLPHCFDMLHCHISFICYIAFVLLHCFDVLHCHIDLIYYIAFNMSHCFDMLHCFWYATLPHCCSMILLDMCLIYIKDLRPLEGQ